ncbi:FAD-dependent oxidoreductase, partial [Vibrio natriegens]|uniref:FAD-dependent oxidoreductase n=1 Tax=Vibrio natriegens TaxID=691 RepID=UPI002283302A
MQTPIVIIGSGFAAYQLVKTVRRMDAHIPIQIFTTEDGAEYNKPDLSHVFSRKQTASDLVIKSGDVFAKENNIELFANTKVEKVDVYTQQVTANGQVYPYGKLVFATGAKAFVPPMNGDGVRDVLTLNSLQEYQAAETHISRAKRVLIIGGGLIGVEIAMDLANSGKNVTVIEPNTRLLANLIPEFIALP